MYVPQIYFPTSMPESGHRPQLLDQIDFLRLILVVGLIYDINDQNVCSECSGSYCKHVKNKLVADFTVCICDQGGINVIISTV